MKFSIGLITFIIAGCSFTSTYVPDYSQLDESFLPLPNTRIAIDGLSACIDTDDDEINIDSNSPITVLVHGCNGSSGRFRSLAQLYAFHGQQAICFNYDDRDSLNDSAEKLSLALTQLSKISQGQEISVIGHSMGGLIARKALEVERKNNIGLVDRSLALTTISAPFSGIEAADHCGMESLHWLTLGIVPSICWMVTGNNWNEITFSSRFIRQPQPLIPEVHSYLKIVTNEENTCRLTGPEGKCLESDYVFNLSEQHQKQIDEYPNLTGVQVDAGHVEIIGNKQIVPRKLLSILQSYGMLAETPRERKKAFERLLSRLY